MALETATYISELIATNPVATDPKGQGDDHLRLLKEVLIATLPNASKKFYFPQGTTLQTSTVTVTTADDNKVIPVSCESAARTVNLPQGSTLWDGFTVTIVKADHSNNALTVDGYSAETINGDTTQILWQRYQSIRLQYVTGLSGWIAAISYIPAIGTVQPWTSNTVAPGWLLANGTTIGDATSGAAQRAAVDTRGLFYHLWANYSNTVCPVLPSGRGASAQADYDAHKTLGLLDLRGRSWFGLDDMGSSAAGRLAGATLDETTLGASGGTDTVTIAQNQLPDVEVDITIIDPGHNHDGAQRAGATADGPGGAGFTAASPTVTSTEATGITATASSINGGVTQVVTPILPPLMLGNWMIKL